MNDGTLAFCILISQRERGKAIGIGNDTQDLRGLAAYVRHGQKAQAKGAIGAIVQATWIQTMIAELTLLSERIADHIEANIEDDDTRSEGLYTMTKLESYITHLGEKLEALL